MSFCAVYIGITRAAPPRDSTTQPSRYLRCGSAFMRFAIQNSCLVIAEPKSVTLAFDCQISGVSFSELTVMLDFWFGERSCFGTALVSFGL
jgi:hypothetical protein